MIYVVFMRICNRIKSVLKIIIYKCLYGKQLSILDFFSNHYKGKLDIQMLDRDSKVFMGKNNISVGPLYILCSGEGKITIGSGNFFNHNVSLTAKRNILIGNECMFGNNVVIVDHDHNVSVGIEKIDYIEEDIVINDYCWIGANVTITKGVSIGCHSVVAANSVVNKSIPEGEMWGGVPAKKIKSIDFE